MPSIALSAQLACIWETSACNPGNAHRFRDFDDTSYIDFLASAAAIAPILDAAPGQTVGATILAAVAATRQVVAANTNLGIILLLAPLAAAGEDARKEIGSVLRRLTVDDAKQAYEAIRLAAPAGLGQVDEQDVYEEPSQTLLEVMKLAAERDLIALQYADGFREVFVDGIDALRHGLKCCSGLEDAVIYAHLALLARFPDSSIARKRGPGEAQQASLLARRVLDAEWPHPRARTLLDELDHWHRAVERGRNPGTISDLVTASLFVALRQNIIQLPSTIPWSNGATHA
jgi:triphosphoribosyl-dephospho-CoA synthase